MQHEPDDPIVFCRAPTFGSSRTALFGIFSRDIETLGDLRKEIRSRTGLLESQQLFINAYVDKERRIRLDRQDDGYPIKRETLPNPLRLLSSSKWPTGRGQMTKGDKKALFRDLEYQLRLRYSSQWGVSRYLPLFASAKVAKAEKSVMSVKSVKPILQSQNHTEAEKVAKAKSKLYYYILDKGEESGQPLLNPMVDMIKSLAAEGQSSEDLIDSMNSEDSVKLSSVFDKLDTQSWSELVGSYVHECSSRIAGSSTTLRDLLSAAQLNCAALDDEKFVERLETLVQAGSMHGCQVAYVLKEHIPAVAQYGKLALATREEVRLRLSQKLQKPPSDLYTQMRDYLLPEINSLGLTDSESWVCMDILNSCDDVEDTSQDFMSMGVMLYTLTGERSPDLFSVMYEIMQLHKKLSVRAGRKSVNKLFSILSAKHGETFGMPTKLRCLKMMYHNT